MPPTRSNKAPEHHRKGKRKEVRAAKEELIMLHERRAQDDSSSSYDEPSYDVRCEHDAPDPPLHDRLFYDAPYIPPAKDVCL